MKRIAYTQEKDAGIAVSELKQKLDPEKGELLIYFASSNYDVDALALEINNQFEIDSIGCTTSGELLSGKMLDDSVVAICIEKEIVEDFDIQVLEGLDGNLDAKVNEAFASFEKHFGSPVSSLDYQKHVGIVLVDGLSGKEEAVNNALGNKSDIVFVGGSAGDDLKFKKTHVFANGKAYSNAAVLALLKPTKGYEILKTQSFKSSSEKLTVTKVVEDERRIQEFNGKPATEAYAEALNCAESEVEGKFFRNPLGLMFDENEPFVRSPRVADGKDILFYCSIKEGQELNLLKSQDIVSKTSDALKSMTQNNGDVSCLINFNCILRKLELVEKKQDEAYGNIFKDIPTVGFHTYGESYIGHINQTATMLLLK